VACDFYSSSDLRADFYDPESRAPLVRRVHERYSAVRARHDVGRGRLDSVLRLLDCGDSG